MTTSFMGNKNKMKYSNFYCGHICWFRKFIHICAHYIVCNMSGWIMKRFLVEFWCIFWIKYWISVYVFVVLTLIFMQICFFFFAKLYSKKLDVLDLAQWIATCMFKSSRAVFDFFERMCARTVKFYWIYATEESTELFQSEKLYRLISPLVI